jgi:hypothetical protein
MENNRVELEEMRASQLGEETARRYRSSAYEYDKNFHGPAEGMMERHFRSNEAQDYLFFPYIKDLKGAFIGVGADQMLDMFVNSQAREVFIVDYTEQNSLVTRALLEVGLYHKKTWRKNPNVEEFIRYFSKENGWLLSRILLKNMTFEEVDQVENVTNGQVAESLRLDEPDFSDYLRAKARLVDDSGAKFSWLSSDSNLSKIIDAYENNRIHVVKGSISDQTVMTKISKHLADVDLPVDALYMSNIEEYIGDKWEACELLRGALEVLPISKKAVILRTKYGTVKGSAKLNNEADELISGFFKGEFWHYNVQKFGDWMSKVKAKPEYIMNRWAIEVRKLQDRGKISSNTGFSTLGF